MKYSTILYIYPSKSTFIQKDIDFLNKELRVKESSIPWEKRFLIISFIRQLVYLLGNVKKCDVVFVMFGGYWSFLPSLLGRIYKKPVCIILGGTDCVSYPSINYGSLRKPILRWFIKKSYKNATKLIPVHESLISSTNNYYLEEEKKQGVQSFFPNLKTPFSTIYNGFDISYFNNDINVDHFKSKNSFISVALVDSERRFILKGFDLIYQLAEIHTNCTFTLVGMSESLEERLNLVRPSNLIIYGALKQKEFGELLSQSQFYLQLSISEGFPNALCEGMLHGCIPIGSNVASIPDIIADTGYIVEQRGIEYISTSVRSVINMSESILTRKRKIAIERIRTEYSIEIRKKKFYGLINALLN